MITGPVMTTISLMTMNTLTTTTILMGMPLIEPQQAHMPED